MAKKLILPKQTSEKRAFTDSLEIFYNEYKAGRPWVSNKDYKRLMVAAMPSLAKKNQADLVKQSELVRYFGLAERDFKKNQTRITPRGINFYELYIKGRKSETDDILIKSMLNDSFGRNNTAIEGSDSDIDPPKLFLRSIYDLGAISRKDFEYLLYGAHDQKYDYDYLIRNLASLESTALPESVHNKYRDTKFVPFLKKEKLIDEKKRKLYLSSYLKIKYGKDIRDLSIKNTGAKTPALTTVIVAPTKTTIVRTKDEDDVNQEEVAAAKAYDKTDPKFNRDNNRTPVATMVGKGRKKYKTLKRISKTALKDAGFKCEHDKSHATFTTPKGEQFTEAHHLIPMCAQGDKEFISINLDRVENIISLCPNCHSAIHLGSDAVKKALLKKLFIAREPKLKKVGITISFNDLWNKYYK